MGKKDINSLSADELFALAEKREKEEKQQEIEKNREALNALKSKRKELLAKHKSELSEIDKKIRKLGGKSTVSKGRQSGASATIMDLLSKGEMDTKSLREKLGNKGISVNNLGQTLAYLKRNGKILSKGRGLYTKA